MTLHDPNVSNTHPNHIDFSKRVLKPVSDEVSYSAAHFLQTNTPSSAHPSPLLIHWLYQATVAVNRFNAHLAQTGESFGKPDNVRMRLEFLSRRWLAAGK